LLGLPQLVEDGARFEIRSGAIKSDDV
jgi:hypothetical protein